jgi:DNA-binding transcriptional MerR regulator
MERRGLQIGQVSGRTGVSIDAIRFYEKQRLLESPARTEGGFRLFRAGDISRIRFIRRAQQLGFSLPEIRELMVLQREGEETCSHVRDLLRGKISAIRQKIRELSTLEAELATSLRKCERKLRQTTGSHGECCPVLEEMANRASHES